VDEPDGDALSPNCGRKDRKLLLVVRKFTRMISFRIAAAALSVVSGLALAQSPGVGETRPRPPADSASPQAAPKQPELRREESEARERPSQCAQLAGKTREECLRTEREPAAGATRPAEPPTAPPPQNPR